MLVIAMPYLTGFWVLSKVQESLGVNIEGTLRPDFKRPFSFNIINTNFIWDEKVELVSGDINIVYNLNTILTAKPIRVRITGQKLRTRLVGDFSYLSDLSEVTFDSAVFDFDFTQDGINDIYFLTAQSPKVQFNISKTEKALPVDKVSQIL